MLPNPKHHGTLHKVSCNDIHKYHLQQGSEHDRAIIKEACEPSAAQYESLKKLLHWITSRTSVKLDNESIVGHCEFQQSHGDGHGDPVAFDWRRIGLSNHDKLEWLKTHDNACHGYGLYDR